MEFSTLFFGKNFIELDSVDSTNNYAANLLNTTKVPDGTVIMAHFQNQGRGQYGNQWVSEANKNLMCSIVVSVPFLTPDNIFLLSKVTAIATNKTVEQITGLECWIKWPNDIYLEGKKLSGMLIENKWSGKKCTAIIGIGINVNQVDFADLNATSIQVAYGQEYDIKHVLSILVSNLELNYLKLRNSSIKSIEKEYLENLLFFEECRSYRKPDGSEFEGIIKDVLNTGHLVIDSKGKSNLFSFKEVFPVI